MSKKWIDKKKATTYQLVHRSFDDPLIHDEEVGQTVLVKKDNLNDKAHKEARKNKYISGPALASQADEFARQGRRNNEGEAAMYGITFDDSQYDYMQHLRPMGIHEDAIFVGKDGKTSLATAEPKRSGFEFKDGDENEEVQIPSEFLPSEIESSEPTWKVAYKSQQAVPDEISGLQPDMDPRLREVLEALEDDEYIGDEDEEDDIFGELLGGGQVDAAKFKATLPEEVVERKDDEEDWEYEFRKFKLEQKKGVEVTSDVGSDVGSDFGSDFEIEEREELHDAVGELPTIKTKKKKKRIGAKTDLTGFSMSSSANYRNDGLTLMDDRFDKIEAEYAQDDEESEEEEFDMAKERSDLEDILDDFLDNYVVQGKKMWKK